MWCNRTVLSLISSFSVACFPAWGAPAVVELNANDLSTFVGRHDYVVVQMTSPDPNCLYCVGADKVFDQVAAMHADSSVAFARAVAPWPKCPRVPPISA